MLNDVLIALSNEPVRWKRIESKGVLILSGLLLIGCSSLRDVEGKETDPDFATFKLRVDLTDPDAPPERTDEEEASPSEARRILELEVTRASGMDSQELHAFEHARLGDQAFSGPGTLRSELDLTAASLVVRFAPFEEVKPFLFTPLVGLGMIERDLVLRTENASKRTQSTLGTVVVGAEVGFRMTDWWITSLRLRRFQQPDLHLDEFEALLNFYPARDVSFFVGWREWKYFEDRDGSNIDYDFSGPVFGLALHL